MERVEKVLAYIYRIHNDEKEVLVFDHPDVPEVNPQVPAGTLHNNERPIDGVIREVFEESGLRLDQTGNYLGLYKFINTDKKQINLRHVFQFTIKQSIDCWSHKVRSDDDDNGEVFAYYWLPIEVAKKKLVSEMGKYL